MTHDSRPGTAELLAHLARHYSEMTNEQAEVLAIVHTPRESAVEIKQKENLPYPDLGDDNGRLHREFGAVDSQGLEASAVYVTDRFGSRRS